MGKDSDYVGKHCYLSRVPEEWKGKDFDAQLFGKWLDEKIDETGYKQFHLLPSGIGAIGMWVVFYG
jgi:hypothetical protein